MLRFGVISPGTSEDWHSRRIAEECAARGAVKVVAPTAFFLGESGVRVAGRDAREIDVWLLPRALAGGDPDFQCGVYRALEEMGLPVINPVGALLDAEDKIRTSWLLARAGLPTPAFAAAQSLDDARAAWAELGEAVRKPPYGSLGIGVERVIDVAQLERALDEDGL